jgi:hypothetical protein
MAADTGSTYGMMKYSQSLREGMDEKIWSVHLNQSHIVVLPKPPLSKINSGHFLQAGIHSYRRSNSYSVAQHYQNNSETFQNQLLDE